MRPSHAYAPGAPNKLPDQKPHVDRKGNVVLDGKTEPFSKVWARLRKHADAELNSRRRDR